jgi:hypothetical protein
MELWRDAVNRLDLMEEQARSVLRTKGRMTSIQVARIEEPVSQILLPDGTMTMPTIIFGPDGKPLND